MIKECPRCGEDRDENDYAKGRNYCKPCGRKMCREYKANNKGKISTYNKKYKHQYKAVIKKYNHDYNKANRPTIRVKQKQNMQRRLKIDPAYKIRTNLSKRLNTAVKYQHTKKAKPTMELVGCTRLFLIDWLEWQFKSDMSWDNYGKYWHVDHVIPCSKFDFLDIEEQEKCFHWSNLQPLYGTDNFSKNDTIDLNEILKHQCKVIRYITKYGEKYKDTFSQLEFYSILRYFK